MNEILIALIGALGGGSTILALIKIYQSRQETANNVTLTNENELAKIRTELWTRIGTLEREQRKMRSDYDKQIADLRDEINMWQSKYWQLCGVADQQRDTIAKLQSQVDAMEAGNAKQKTSQPYDA